MPKAPKVKWTFKSKLRPNALGWSSSPIACQRIKEAVAEIQLVAKQDRLAAAEGAIELMARLWPALMHVDSSTGALGSATHRAVDTLIDLLISAPADEKIRAEWLDRLWEIFNEDGVGYVDGLGDRWGELCVFPEMAVEWANTLVSMVRENWEEKRRSGTHTYFNGTDAALSCLLAAGQYQDLLDLLELAPWIFWSYRRYGVRALEAMGRPDDAITYAQASCGLNDRRETIDSVCEAILLRQGRSDEAYARYALTSCVATTNIATFRALKKKYPDREPRGLLEDLVARSAGEEGKWFATAKELKLYDLALELAGRSPTEPKTLTRAARDHQSTNPEFALGAAMAALHWIIEGYGYEIQGADVMEAYQFALNISDALGCREPIEKQIHSELTANNQHASFARKALGLRMGR